MIPRKNLLPCRSPCHYVPRMTLTRMTLARLRRAGLFGLVALGAVAASPHLSPAYAAEDSAARTAIFNHPNVVQLRSEVCQYFAQVDIARANKHPQVSLRVHGGTSITDHFERRETASRRLMIVRLML